MIDNTNKFHNGSYKPLQAFYANYVRTCWKSIFVFAKLDGKNYAFVSRKLCSVSEKMFWMIYFKKKSSLKSSEMSLQR